MYYYYTFILTYNKNSTTSILTLFFFTNDRDIYYAKVEVKVCNTYVNIEFPALYYHFS